ncbi:unnamed protein product, partial [marine sediment metagenome]
CTTVFCKDIPEIEVRVQMGKILDGFADHMRDYPDQCTFVLAEEKEATREDLVKTLKESGVEILLNYMPVGSEKATKFYAQCVLEAGVAFINNMPVFVASNPEWAEKFKDKKIPVIGDDIKSQLGATITH